MATWVKPVFDRTQEDVDFAIAQIAEWRKGYDIGSVKDLKGCLSHFDLYAIETNIAYISENLNELGYEHFVSTKKWTKNDVPTEEDIKRILGNIDTIISVFHSPTNAPALPLKMTHFTEINAIEENLYLLKELLDWMVKSFPKSGTFQSGSTFRLPIRR